MTWSLFTGFWNASERISVSPYHSSASMYFLSPLNTLWRRLPLSWTPPRGRCWLLPPFHLLTFLVRCVCHSSPEPSVAVTLNLEDNRDTNTQRVRINCTYCNIRWWQQPRKRRQNIFPCLSHNTNQVPEDLMHCHSRKTLCWERIISNKRTSSRISVTPSPPAPRC